MHQLRNVMKIFGTQVSPFARRVRILLANVEHEFVDLDIFSEQGRAILTDNNPAKKVPVLKDGEQLIYDSRIIFNYLSEKLTLRPLSWQQQNLLTVIDAVNDSLVVLMYSRRSGLPADDDFLYFNLQRERITSVMSSLNQSVTNGEFSSWEYPSICLYCLLDWGLFREVLDLHTYPELLKFHQVSQHQTGVVNTDPRL